MANNHPRGKASLLTIFVTVFIDMLGVGIIIPVIPALFFDPDSSFFAAGTSEAYRSIVYGFLIAAYPVLQFFGAPVLGALSDRYGRRPMLSLSLFGTLLGYVLFALAIYSQNLPLLFVSRMLPGFTGGNISIVFSSIADVSTAEARARNFGLVGMAFGLGFILGPTLGGLLADDQVLPWFNAATPFWFTAALTLFNIILVQFRFRETLEQRRTDRRISFLSGFRNVAYSFRTPNLRRIFLVVLLLSLGFTFFTQFYSVLLIQRFQFSEKDIGLLYGWIGIWLALTQGGTVRILSRYFSSARILRVSIVGLSLALGLILLPDEGWWFYLIAPLIATFQGITAPNLTAVVSEQASFEQQGEILGVNQSMQSLGQAIPPIIAGYINTISNSLPVLTAAVLTFLGWGLYMWFYGRKEENEERG